MKHSFAIYTALALLFSTSLASSHHNCTEIPVVNGTPQLKLDDQVAKFVGDQIGMVDHGYLSSNTPFINAKGELVAREDIPNSKLKNPRSNLVFHADYKEEEPRSHTLWCENQSNRHIAWRVDYMWSVDETDQMRYETKYYYGQQGQKCSIPWLPKVAPNKFFAQEFKA